MADSDAPYQPNRFRRPPPLPDEMKGSPIYKRLPNGEMIRTGNRILRPNDPMDRTNYEPPTDKRPVKLLEEAGYESAEEWGNAILAKRNGHGG